MAPLSINTSSNSATNRTIKSISPLSLSTTTSNQSSMKQLIRLIGVAILCFGAGLQFGRDSSVQQINLSSSNSISSSSSSSKDIVLSNAILTKSNNDSVEEQPSSPTRRTNNINAKNNKRPNKIVLLGERHSGTNWITNYLKECFITNNASITVQESFKRFKHWFQEDDLSLSVVEEDSAVVVSMFRDPMDWVEAMRAEPHHAHDHLNWHEEQHPFNSSKFWHEMASPLDWKAFITKPWMGNRGPIDYNISHPHSSLSTEESIKNAQCMDSYTYIDAAPCSAEDSPKLLGLGEYKYEFNNDGSERAFNSILELRAAKIINHLSVAKFRGTHSYFYYRFEDLKVNGTTALLKDIEEATGIEPKCDVIYGKVRNENGQVTTEEEKQEEVVVVQRIEKVRRRRQLREKIITKKRELSVDFIKYMNKYVDWEVESLIGYYPREV